MIELAAGIWYEPDMLKRSPVIVSNDLMFKPLSTVTVIKRRGNDKKIPVRMKDFSKSLA